MPPNGGSGDVLFFCFRLYNPFLMVPLMKAAKNAVVSVHGMSCYWEVSLTGNPVANTRKIWSDLKLGPSHIAVNRRNS